MDCQIKNITNQDQTSLLLEDLIIWTNYEIEVAAYNGAGRGTYSHKVTEWTLQGGEGLYLALKISFTTCNLMNGSFADRQPAAWNLQAS